MSLFKKKAPKYNPPPAPMPAEDIDNHQSNGLDNNNGSQKSQLVFHCQQAQGSPLGLISGFSNVKELYQKIAECYDFPPEDSLENEYQSRVNAMLFNCDKKEHTQRQLSNERKLVQASLVSMRKGKLLTLQRRSLSQLLSQFLYGQMRRNRVDVKLLREKFVVVLTLAELGQGRTRITEVRREVDLILFCTLNTHKVDMRKLLGGQIGLEDFIFAHRKGRPKEIEIVKTEDALGLTITDNGAGYAFIKRIKEGSIVSRIPHIEVGDHIEKLDGENMIGKRHYEVAKLLKEIPKGTTFTIRLVEPLKSGFGSIGPKTSGARAGRKSNYGSGKETLRFKANGPATIENEHDERSQAGIDKINGLLESFMGINDTELATQMWDIAEGKTNSMQLAEAIDNSDLQEFGFTDEFIIELWGVITDARSGRLN
ncbi:PDZ domain-containing protein GIPC1 [Papilio xuthus]|uniref:PDZ domain-containing protein GIPC1 n=1 Tax=Papilio xuthus TaxID=66420 RepID=A0A194PYL8_PAPXU|nr:PDZ domain-containing protein GIPC1 [Papilio xuthus]